MKILNDNVKTLIIPPAIDGKVLVKDIGEANKLLTINDETFLVLQKSYENERCHNIEKLNDYFEMVGNFNIEINNINSIYFDSSFYFDEKESFIVDMQGISSFLFAKSMDFSDLAIRQILLELDIIKNTEKYLRIGASGARKSQTYTGGEVLEYSLIDGNDGSGISKTVSGYLPDNDDYSVTVSMKMFDKETLIEDRIIYSHTAFLKKCDKNYSNTLSFTMIVKSGKVSLLDAITNISDKIGIKSCAMQIKITTKVDFENSTIVTGRVLKSPPNIPLKCIQDATDSAIEKTFPLDQNQALIAYGTKYDRFEPEWEKFTGGRVYEKRGHIHATIVGDNSKFRQHKTFHLREVEITNKSYVEIMIVPIKYIYKICPVENINGMFYCKSTLKNIDEVIQNFNKR